MREPLIIVNIALLVPLAVIITYYDVRYRRIPNAFVLATLVAGLSVNTLFSGLDGARSSLAGCALAFGLMFVMHVFGAMGAGDVKLFAAVGSVVGVSLVPPTLLTVVLTGGVLALCSTLRAGTLRTTLQRAAMILAGLLPGWQVPRFSVPADKRHTIPYGVAITLGSLIAVAVFRA
ncbi:MAG TPA: A24 family peptidase [Pyrinomonadaceae bacterium]|jgi:prepilin peptidase CpaA